MMRSGRRLLNNISHRDKSYLVSQSKYQQKQTVSEDELRLIKLIFLSSQSNVFCPWPPSVFISSVSCELRTYLHVVWQTKIKQNLGDSFVLDISEKHHVETLRKQSHHYVHLAAVFVHITWSSSTRSSLSRYQWKCRHLIFHFSRTLSSSHSSSCSHTIL